MTQADERLLCATPVITDSKGVTVAAVAAEPVSEHQIHAFIIFIESESDTAPFYSWQPRPPNTSSVLLRRADHQIPQLLVATGWGGMWDEGLRRNESVVAAAIQRGGGRGIRTESLNSSPTA